MTSLDISTITQLLNEEKLPAGLTSNAPKQYGPLRWYDVSYRCASRGCSSPTYCKVNGIPKCSMHALHELNDMLSKEQEGLDDQQELQVLQELPGTL